MRRLPLTQRLLALVGAAILPVLGALLYFIVSVHAERLRQVHDLALATSRIAALEMERIVTGAEGVLEAIAYAPAVRYLSGEACHDYLAAVASRLPHLRGFAVVDAQGGLRCVAGIPLDPAAVSTASWFVEAIGQDGPVVGEFTGDRPDDAPFLPIALAMREGDEAVGVVVTGVDLAWLGGRLRERNLAHGSALAIADRAGVIIAREPDSEQFVGHSISEANMALVRATEPGTVEIEGPDGDRVIGFQPPAATGTSLYVGAAISTREAFAPINASTFRSLALAAAGAAIACALAWVVGDRLFRQPILRMLKTIAAWRSGKESARTGLIPEGSELADLGAAIDEYMDKLVVDRAARRRAEERRSLLLREMNHRIKNILATVQALANQTFKGKTSAESLEAFGRRLSAMAATHDLLVSERWESAELRKTIEAVIGPFDPGGRFTLDGPDLEITAKAALGLSMALHELCTNAAKYGALSCPEGSVDLRWRLQWDDDGGRFGLSWTEEGGPEIVEPKSSGFGTRLIEAALGNEMSATVSMRYPPSGAAVTIDADADLVLADSGARREGLAAE